MADTVVSTVKINIEADIGDSESRINRLNDALRNIGKNSGSKEIGKAEKKVTEMSGALGKLGRALGRIALYRALRSAIKAITTAFSEGLQNAYTFSSGIEGESHRFAAAMDSMKVAGGVMKNQLGSAFIGLLTAIAPIVNAIIAMITRLAAALSQLFAVFTGGTWLKATQGAEDLAGACGGGAAAAKEWKNQLLGFDEINRLEEPADGGGGGGGGGGALGGMFEEAEVDGIFKTIRDKFQELVAELDFGPLQEAWGRLKEAASDLGDTIKRGLGWAWENVLKPLAHWTIEKGLPEVINLLAAAFDFLGAALEFCAPFFKELWDDFLAPIASFIGDAFIEFLRTLTELLRDLTALLKGEMSFREFIDQLTPLEAILLAVGTAFGVVYGAILLFNGVMTICTTVATVLGGVFAFLTSPIGLVVIAIAALIAIGILLYQHWDEIKAKAIEVWDNIVAKWNEAKENLTNSWNEFKTNAKQSFEETWANRKQPFEEAIEKVKAAWDEFTGWIEGKWNEFKNWWENLHLGSFHLKLPHIVAVGEFSLKPLRVPSFYLEWPEYALGGFPEDGLFMANHGELVGKFANGKTAVANNEQIIEGIRRGVTEAMMTVMGNDSGGNGTRVAVLNVNGREFARAIFEDGNAVANEHGISLITA